MVWWTEEKKRRKLINFDCARDWERYFLTCYIIPIHFINLQFVYNLSTTYLVIITVVIIFQCIDLSFVKSFQVCFVLSSFCSSRCPIVCDQVSIRRECGVRQSGAFGNDIIVIHPCLVFHVALCAQMRQRQKRSRGNRGGEARFRGVEDAGSSANEIGDTSSDGMERFSLVYTCIRTFTLPPPHFRVLCLVMQCTKKWRK